ncbi:MAG: MFS transporter [Armatimonadetes bacterium]|nr:MFS transporter [Armatimonadota bacterium]
MPTVAPTEQRSAEKFSIRAGLAIVLAASFAVDFAVSMVGLAIQFLGIRLGAPPFVLGLYGAAGAGVYAVVCLAAGRLSDRFGRRISVVALSVVGVVWLFVGAQKTPMSLLAFIPIGSAALALFWPSVQAWLGDLSATPDRLTKALGSFNVLWTAGLMLGPVACGYLWMLHYYSPFFAGTALVWTTAASLLAVPVIAVSRGSEEPGHQMDRPNPLADAFLPVAWTANFASWYVAGSTRALLPKLADELGFTEVLTGWLVFSFYVGQAVTFLALRQMRGWQYRRWPLVAGLAWGLTGMALVAVARAPLTFAIGLAVAGASVGMTYVASLFYSLQAPLEQRGWRSGIHEAVVGAGLSTGPLIGGIAASFAGARAPFFCAVAVLGLVVLVVSFMAARSHAAQRP